MKLWKITAATWGYDTYDSAIVAAKNEDAAKAIHPGGKWPMEAGYDDGSWVSNPARVIAELIGTAIRGTKEGVILASFNAG